MSCECQIGSNQMFVQRTRTCKRLDPDASVPNLKRLPIINTRVPLELWDLHHEEESTTSMRMPERDQPLTSPPPVANSFWTRYGNVSLTAS